MPPCLKLAYFNARGRAEGIRLLMAASGKEYEDFRITFDQWPKMKGETPWGTLPVLFVDGCPIGESGAICRYIAEESGMMGSNSVQEANVNSIYEVVTDIREKFFTYMRNRQTEEKQEQEKTKDKNQKPKVDEMLENFIDDTLQVKLKPLQRKLEDNNDGRGFLVGKKMSLADVQFFHCMEVLFKDNKAQSKVTEVVKEEFPKLFSLYQRIESDEKIAKWLKERPQTTN